jgi:hypothetical protein
MLLLIVKNKKYGVGGGSNGITFIPSFVKNCPIVLKLKVGEKKTSW